MKAGALGIAVTALALIWLASRYELGDLAQSIGSADLGWLLLAPLFVAISLALRATRWRLLFAGVATPKWGNAFAALSAGYLFNNVLPSHAGLLVRSFLLGRREGIAQSRVLGTVVLEKALDLSLFVALALLIVAARPVPDWLRQGALTLLGIGLVALIFMVFAPKFIALMTGRMAPLLDFLGTSMAARLRRVLEGLADGLNGLGAPTVLMRIVGLSALIWVSEVAFLSTVAAAFGIALPLVDRLFVLVVIATGIMIPAAPGYVGTYEAFGALAFEFLGQPKGVALACVVTLHAIQLSGTSVLGAVGLVMLRDSLGIRGVLQLVRGAPRAQEAVAMPAPAAIPPQRPVVVAAILVWMLAMTAVYLLLNGPPGLLFRMEQAYPAFAELRGAFASLFYRDYVY
jgi:glycosyltransferase 2 family protein